MASLPVTTPHTTFKQSIVNKYASENIIKQHTPEWFQVRAQRVGSSEVWMLRKGLDYYVSKKQSSTPIHQNACHFGTIFEAVAKKFLRTCAMNQNTPHNIVQIYECGSIPFQSTTIPLAASPDGIFFSLPDKSVPEAETNCGSAHLVEIKCPLWRNVAKSNGIPDKYKDQMETQLLCVPEAADCHYYEFQFRVCNGKQYKNGCEYNRWLHIGRRKNNPSVVQPICKGVVIFDDSTPIPDKCPRDIGYGVWERAGNGISKNEVTIPDPSVHAIEKIIMHPHTNELPPVLFHEYKQNPFLCWHLDYIQRFVYKRDSCRSEEIIAMVDRDSVRQAIKTINEANTSKQSTD